MAAITHTPIIIKKAGRRKKAHFNCTYNDVTMEVTLWADNEEELQTKIKNFLSEENERYNTNN